LFNLIVIAPRGKTLLLDLDETLIHSCSLKEGPEHIVKAKGEYGEEAKVFFSCLY
jgi:CTD small phosphatase-like protein 2